MTQHNLNVFCIYSFVLYKKGGKYLPFFVTLSLPISQIMELMEPFSSRLWSFENCFFEVICAISELPLIVTQEHR